MMNKLSTQIGALFFLSIIIIMGNIFWFEYKEESETLPALLENEAVLSTIFIASGINHLVLYKKPFKIWKKMSSIQQRLSKNDRISMISFAILNDEKLVLSHSNPDKHPIMKPMQIPSLGALWSDETIQITQAIYHPSDDSIIGYITLQFHADLILEELQEIQEKIFISASWALFISILLAFFIAYRVSLPLRKISTLASRIGCGEMDVSMFSAAPQEIQLLAYAMKDADNTICQKNTALIKNQGLLKSILDHSPAVVFIKQVNGRYMLINKHFETLFHIQQEDILDKTAADVFDADIAKRLHERDLEIMTHGKAFTMEEMIPDDRGMRYYVFLRFPLLNAEGQVEAICGIATDITDQKRIDAEIRKLAAVIEQADELVVLTDKNGVIEYVNEAFEYVTGYQSTEVIGKTPNIIKSGRHSKAYYAAMWKTLHDGKVWQGDFINKKKNGEPYVVSQSIAPIKNELGEITGFSSVQRDVTHIRKVQQKLQHSDRVESLGVLAGGIAHDFNNLLTAILGNVSLALTEIDRNSPAMKYLNSIEHASHSAADLCRQMLAYSGKGKFVVEAINLSDLVENMCKLIGVSIEKNVVLKYHLSDNIPSIDADIAQIKQIVLNLITNASEAIEGKSGVVSVTTGVMNVGADYLNGCISGEDLEPGRYVYLEVSDTGSGMDRDTQKKIFDPFFTTKFTGRGLGMSAMLGIVQGHHGGLRIYSELKQGTTIKIVFPISGEEAIKNQHSIKKIPQWQGSGSVLLVDDEETLREVGSAMLEHIGFDVITANDGIEGVEAYLHHQNDIKLVILDMTMPRMDGQTCFRELRRINPDVCVLLSSGYNEQDVTDRFAGKGLAGFIQKPYSLDVLANKLQQALQP
ncbi:MAG: PAS domain S-box protein [Mariprofundaceae bacterium]|nr:PAS domain S-box protein [Mariprofundaceae bacterium]